LTKVYGAETVVDRFDAVVAAGEFFSLLGPSGSGKTTTLMMIAGFAPIDAGELVVDGRDVSAVPPEKRGFGMVFQNYAIFPHLDVFENVAFPLRARGMPKDDVGKRVAWALGLVQLGHLGDRFARQLSGGQQQRVAIARAIVFHPGIVLMDEPLGALDKNLRYDMQLEIKDIQQRLGMTVVYVTHDQEEAMNLSDRMAIMNRGRVEQIGAPSEVYEHPVNTFTAKFLGEANLLDGIVAGTEPGGAKIRLSGGQVLQVGRAHKLGSASPARLFVRPEKLALSPPGSTEGDANRLAGRVHRASFLGNIVRYAVEIEGGGTMLADAPNLSRGFRPAVGEAVTVSWSPADSSLLDPDA
jgi:spermidine/putrescine ABC transporter ATP-binding subunit